MKHDLINTLNTGYLILLKVSPYYLLGIFLIIFAKFFLSLTTPKIKLNNEIVEKNNGVVGFVLASYIVSIGLVLNSMIINHIGDYSLSNLLNLLIIGLLAIILIRFSMFINDKLILYKFSITNQLINKESYSTSFIVGGGMIATSLIFSGVLSLETDNFTKILIYSVIYFFIGQVFLILAGVIYQGITKYDIHYEIENRENKTVGIAMGGFLIASGLIIKSSLTSLNGNILAEVIFSLILILIGFIFLIIVRKIVDWVFLPKTPLNLEVVRDQNIAAGVIVAASYIIVALLYHSIIIGILTGGGIN